MARSTIIRYWAALASVFVAVAVAHGGHDQVPVAEDADWATRHMAGKMFYVF